LVAKSFEGKTVWITGASSGIGEAMGVCLGSRN
jgi:NADP-dependent 3-hydroxy acid dehydrogenase YdfG